MKKSLPWRDNRTLMDVQSSISVNLPWYALICMQKSELIALIIWYNWKTIKSIQKIDNVQLIGMIICETKLICHVKRHMEFIKNWFYWLCWNWLKETNRWKEPCLKRITVCSRRMELHITIKLPWQAFLLFSCWMLLIWWFISWW
jgi:hypothetical protein